MTELLGWAVVGLGQRSRELIIPSLLASPLSRIIGACGSSPEKTKTQIDAWPDLRAYASMGEMLADPEVKVVYIATPHYHHVPQAVQSIDAGKHVFMESPLALSVDGANKLVEKARARKVMIGVAFNYRFHAAVRELKAMIQNGELGAIQQLEVALSEPVVDPAAWWSDSQRAGPAALLRLGVHALDLVAWLKGSAVAELTTMSSSEQPQDGVNAITRTILRFEDGTLGAATGAIGGLKNHRIVVEGETARAEIQGDLAGAGAATLTVTKNGDKQQTDFDPQDLIGSMLDGFSSAAIDETEFSPDGVEGKKVVEITCAVIDSMKSKRVARVGEALRVT